MKRRLATTVSSLLVLSTVLAACGKDTEKTATNSQKDKKQTLRLTTTTEIPSMDSAKTTDSMSFEVLDNVNEGLLRLGEGDEVVDGVAKKDSVEVSKDGLTYTFHLRDTQWSNGEPVTANDFVYGWQRAVDPKTASEYSFILYYVKNAEAIFNGKMPKDQLGVKALDDKTLQVTLEQPTPYFLQLTTFGTYLPENQKWVESKGDQYGLEANTQLYNGPFTLSEWKHEQSFTLKKNPKYWDKDSVKLDEIKYNVVKDTSSAVNLYENGDIDKVMLDSEYVDKYKNDPEYKTQLDARLVFFRFNEKLPIFKNAKARKAFDLAYDKEAITSTILNDGSKPAYWLVPSEWVKGPDSKDFRDHNGDFNKYNVEEAKKLWAEAKKELGKDTFELKMLSYDDTTRKKAAEYVAGELEKNLPGLKITVAPQPFEIKLDNEKKLDYDFSFSGWGPDYPDPMTFIDMFLSNSPFNEMAYNNPQYDQLVNAAKKEADPQKRWDDMIEAEKVIMDEAGISPIYQRGRAYLQKDSVKGIIAHKFGGDFSYKWASNEKK
ncbi:peptide ABC transporter substrate-binding protein [Bacillus sp. AFS088145]|uniref:peptide ABC transporter substrate-binding protein n=1 Tax=Bacillus sp. AFS088145 TaxID=2033514 RepID=UPI000BF929FA|nr:peptide ABC transporter substrate-binding protein [Bacillus sp. AFS088145]PFH84441.1 peptide ABC transporter substrate-binding protein [Bacillus sp. AFS088145]